MISFQMLNVLIGLIAAIVVAFIAFKYAKRKISSLTSKHQLIVALSSIAAFFIAFGLCNILLYPPYQEWALKKEIRNIPIISVIKQYHPKEYQNLLVKADDSIKHHENNQDFLNYSYTYVNKIFLHDLKSAPDSAIYDYIIQANHFYETIYKVDPQYVIRMEEGDFSIRKDLFLMLKDPDFKDIFITALKAKKNIIEQAAKNPSAPPPENIVMPAFKRIMGKLNDKYGDEAVSNTFFLRNKEISPEIKARIIMDFYREIANLNQAEMGDLMRYIASLSSQKQ